MKSKYAETPLSEQIQNDYFDWLCDHIHIDVDDFNYWILMSILHRTEFFSLIPNDENREADGKKLRDTFSLEMDFDVEGDLDGPCSILEMLIALSAHMEYQVMIPTDGDPAAWFWEMIRNLDLDRYTNDRISSSDYGVIDHILKNFLERNYQRKGQGGLFPLKEARKDQRNVEIWYQMHAYLLENYYDDVDG